MVRRCRDYTFTLKGPFLPFEGLGWLRSILVEDLHDITFETLRGNVCVGATCNRFVGKMSLGKIAL